MVLSFIIGTLLSIWDCLIALLHLGNMQAQHRKDANILDISSLSNFLIQLICSRLTYLNEDAADRDKTICGIAIKVATMNESIEDVFCSQ